MMKWFRRRPKDIVAAGPPAAAVERVSPVDGSSSPAPPGAGQPLDAETGSVPSGPSWPQSRPVVGEVPWSVEEMIKVEEYRLDDTMIVRAELPGVNPEKDVRLTIVDGCLAIEAEQHEETTAERDGVMFRELRYGAFSRTVPLAAGVTAASISATYKDGLLEVRIPVATATSPAPPPARIPIATS